MPAITSSRLSAWCSRAYGNTLGRACVFPHLRRVDNLVALMSAESNSFRMVRRVHRTRCSQNSVRVFLLMSSCDIGQLRTNKNGRFTSRSPKQLRQRGITDGSQDFILSERNSIRRFLETRKRLPFRQQIR